MGSIISLTADSCGGITAEKAYMGNYSDYIYSRVWFTRTRLKWLFIKFAIFGIETINIRLSFDNANCVNPKFHP